MYDVNTGYVRFYEVNQNLKINDEELAVYKG
jgi:hypothetical protein